jgi:hypothetical protein
MPALPSDYVHRSALDKLELLWTKVSAEPYSPGDLPSKVPSPWGRRKLLSVPHNRVSFEHATDELPEGRSKLVHAHGVVAKVRLVLRDSPYTGVVGSGGPGLLRASDAVGGGTFSPSLAIKFLVDGQASLNYLALPSAYRDPADPDFLTSVYSNSAPAPRSFDTKLIGRAFDRTAKALGGTRLYGIYLPLHHLAQRELDGRAVADAKVPDRIELHASAAARAAAKSGADWRVVLAGLPIGLTLFEVHAAPKIDVATTLIGELQLESSFVASRYGDERLFYQHDVGPTS